MANEAEQALYEKLAAVPTFHPSTASLLPDDWTLEPGDVVTVQSDGQDYLTPVYSMSLDWNGASKVSIQSTGNKKRAPLSALQRRSFSSGRAGYKTQKDLDEAKVIYDRHFTATDKYIASTMTAVGVKLNPDGTPMVDPETGDYVFDDQGATLASKVTATAGELATEVSTRTQQGQTFASQISQTATSLSQVVTAIGSNGEVTAASIVTAINTDDTIGPTSSIRLSADKINLTGYVTATTLDTRLLNADALFSDTGYIGTIRASALTTGGNITSAGAVTGAGLYIGSAAPYTDVSTAIKSFGTSSSSGGSITIPTTTLAGTAGPNINFNIAGTAYYQSHVGIASIGSWAWDSTNSRYSALVTANDATTDNVLLPSIYLGGSSFNSSHKTYVYAYGPQDSGGTRHTVSSSYEVDASGVYSSGQNSVNVAGGTWSGGQKLFSPSVGTGTGQTVQLSKGTESWNGNICTFPIMDSQGSGGQSSVSTGLTCTVDISGHAGPSITALNPTEVNQSAYNSSAYTATSVAHDRYYTVGTTPDTNVGIKFHVPASAAVTIDLNGGDAASYPIRRSSKSALLSALGTTESNAVEIFQRGSSSNNVDISNYWHGFRIDAGSTVKYYYFQNKTPSGGSHNITCSSNVASIGTDRGQRTSAGSISKSGLIANTYLGFTISCGGSSKDFYISVNP